MSSSAQFLNASEAAGRLGVSAIIAQARAILCPPITALQGTLPCIPGTLGYEAVATCLASPEVRARTEGVIAWAPPGRMKSHQV